MFCIHCQRSKGTQGRCSPQPAIPGSLARFNGEKRPSNKLYSLQTLLRRLCPSCTPSVQQLLLLLIGSFFSLPRVTADHQQDIHCLADGRVHWGYGLHIPGKHSERQGAHGWRQQTVQDRVTLHIMTASTAQHSTLTTEHQALYLLSGASHAFIWSDLMPPTLTAPHECILAFCFGRHAVSGCMPLHSLQPCCRCCSSCRCLVHG